MSWTDFNDAEDQNDVLPAGTLAKVRMNIRPGGHDDPQKGWTGGYAKQNPESGACYLDCEFVVLEGKYAKRRVWSRIGLHSNKGEDYANMGRGTIKSILNSARGIKANDKSEAAEMARRIGGFHDLDGIEFVAKIDVERDDRGNDRNKIGKAITPDHKDYGALMHNATAPAATAAPSAAPTASDQPANTGRPSWAQ